MAKAKKEQQYYNGIAIDSQEEIMAIMYFEELIEAGYVEKLGRSQTFPLSERFVNCYTQVVQMKTKAKEVEKQQVLLEGHVYTPEFLVDWTEAGAALFVDRTSRNGSKKFDAPFIGSYQTLIEVKPGFDQNNMTRLFKINQKWMWEKYQLYVNLIQPHKLFEETFTPKAYLTTPTGKQRVIHWKVKSLEEYVNSLKNQ
jgi:hypothetical protein